MIIREATDSDISSIVLLLKDSLGESLTPKSEALWNWKHQTNPFGNSPILVAEDEGKLVGVRSFMCWEYLLDNEVIPAFRAVDTAIHPDYQGKGIFKKLTLSLIEKLGKDAKGLIFNTPNKQSTPGYLKMGWQRWGRLPLKVRIAIRRTKGSLDKTNWEELQALIKEIETYSHQIISNKVQTNLKKGYLNWRYRDCPIVDYQTVSDGKNFLLIYRIKSSKLGNEFRVCDLLLTKSLDSKEKKEMNRLIDATFRQSNCKLLSYSGIEAKNHSFLARIPSVPVGPLITLRQIDQKINPLKLNWAWSLGDLEVF